MKLGHGALLAGLVCLACSSSPFRGGYARPEGRLTGTRSVARFLPGRCEDRAGREHKARFDALELLETRAGQPLLLEHRQGHELLVIDNAHDDGAFLVFELIVNGERLRRYRLPRRAGLGQLELGSDWSEAREGSELRARLVAAQLTCLLLPEAANRASSASASAEPPLRAGP